MSQKKELQNVVIVLMKGAIPERRAELDKLWTKYDPEVRILPPQKGVTLQATGTYIGFNFKTMEVFWLLGFSAWKAIECYSPHVIWSESSGQPVKDLIALDGELHAFERDYKERLKAAQALIDAYDSDGAAWPPDVPMPVDDRSKLEDVQAQAAFDLTCIASAFALLHEFRHVMLDMDKERPADRADEEMQCDVWAREFITSRINDYAENAGHSYPDVLQKRAMGLAVAALMLHEITPPSVYHGGSDYHALIHRLDAAIGETPLPDDDYFWVFMASLMIGIFRQQHRPIDAPSMSPRKLAEYLLNIMRTDVA